MRKKIGTDNEELYLDLHKIPFVTKKYHKTACIGAISISDDHQKIGYLIDLKNDENYILGFKN